MKVKISILLVLLALLTISVIPVAAITWGELDTTHNNVAAMVVDWPGYGPWQYCSGTLIHPQIVLTAGHCTVDLEADGIETIWVSFAPYALDDLRLVKTAITHPDYNWGSSNPHDVGLLILEEAVDDITPAYLPDPGYLNDLKEAGVLRQKTEGAKFTMVGYGGTLEWPPPEIDYDDYRRVSTSEYVALVPAQLHLSQHLFKDNGGTCFGDSGGPAFYTQEDGTDVLVGITSWGDAQCVVTGFYYRVDIPGTLDFIADAIEGLGE